VGAYPVPFRQGPGEFRKEPQPGGHLLRDAAMTTTELSGPSAKRFRSMLGSPPTGVANQAVAMNKAEKICGAALSPSVFLTLCKIY
jgi:hypothetical protein